MCVQASGTAVAVEKRVDPGEAMMRCGQCDHGGFASARVLVALMPRLHESGNARWIRWDVVPDADTECAPLAGADRGCFGMVTFLGEILRQ